MSNIVSFLLLTSCQTQDILSFHNPSLVIPFLLQAEIFGISRTALNTPPSG